MDRKSTLVASSARALEPWLLSLLGGLLLGAPTLSVHLYWTHWFALVPWTVLFTRAERRPGLHVYLAGVALAAFIAHRGTLAYGLASFILLILIHLPLLLPFYLVLRRTGRRGRLPLVLAVPLAWIAVEWLRSRFIMGGIEMMQLAYSHAPFAPFIQIAALFGSLGVSFVLAAVNGALAEAVINLRLEPRPGFDGPRRVLASAAFACGLVLASLAYGGLVLGHELEPGPRVTLVQPRVRHRKVEAEGPMLVQLAFTQEVVTPGSAELVVWPEYAVLDYLDSDLPYREDLTWLARELDADLLVGAYGHAPGDRAAIANTAVLLDREGRLQGRYDKVRLIPWTEYTPLSHWLGRFHRDLSKLERKLAQRSGFSGLGAPAADARTITWRHGDRSLVLGTPLCQEAMIESIARRLVRQGARILINPTSEGGVGFEVQRVVLAASQYRAVENRVPVLRAGNDGISCLIDSEGRIREVLRGRRTGRMILEEGVLATRVPLDSRSGTVYTRAGPVLGLVCLAGSLVVILWRRPRLGRLAVVLAGLAALGVGAAAVAVRDRAPEVPDHVREAEAEIATREGKRYFRHKRDLEALTRLRRALELRPSSSDAALHLAEVCRRRQWHEEGYRSLLGAYDAGAREPRVLEALAYFEYVTDRRAEALEHIAEARALAHDQESLRRLEARVLWTDGRREEAVAKLEEWLDREPDSRAAALELASYELLAARMTAAEARLRTLYESDPQDPEAARLLGRLLVSDGRARQAVPVLRRAVRLEPNDPQGLYLLGRAQLRLGHRKAVDRLAERLFRLTPAGRGRSFLAGDQQVNKKTTHMRKD